MRKVHTWSRLLGNLAAHFTGLYCSSALETSTGHMSEHQSQSRERHVSTLQDFGLRTSPGTMAILVRDGMEGLAGCYRTSLLTLVPFPRDDSSQLRTHVGRELQPSVSAEAYGLVNLLLPLGSSFVLLYIRIKSRTPQKCLLSVLEWMEVWKKNEGFYLSSPQSADLCCPRQVAA